MGLDMYLRKTSHTSDIDILDIKIHDNNWKTGSVLIREDSEKVILPCLYHVNNITLKDGTSYYVSTIEETDSLTVTFKGWDEAVEDSPMQLITVDKDSIDTINYTYAYWRKANQIHNWFVQNVQNGTDDCGEYEVSGSKLLELVKLCEEVSEVHSTNYSDTHLPTVDGFFFGGTSYDDYYYDTTRDTVDMLRNVKPTETYVYHSSW